MKKELLSNIWHETMFAAGACSSIIRNKYLRSIAYHEAGHALICAVNALTIYEVTIKKYEPPPEMGRFDKLRDWLKNGYEGQVNYSPYQPNFSEFENRQVSLNIDAAGYVAQTCFARNAGVGASKIVAAMGANRDFSCSISLVNKHNLGRIFRRHSDPYLSIKEAKVDTHQILADNQDKLDRLVQSLMHHKTLDGNKVYDVLELKPRLALLM